MQNLKDNTSQIHIFRLLYSFPSQHRGRIIKQRQFCYQFLHQGDHAYMMSMHRQCYISTFPSAIDDPTALYGLFGVNQFSALQ